MTVQNASCDMFHRDSSGQWLSLLCSSLLSTKWPNWQNLGLYSQTNNTQAFYTLKLAKFRPFTQSNWQTHERTVHKHPGKRLSRHCQADSFSSGRPTAHTNVHVLPRPLQPSRVLRVGETIMSPVKHGLSTTLSFRTQHGLTLCTSRKPGRSTLLR